MFLKEKISLLKSKLVKRISTTYLVAALIIVIFVIGFSLGHLQAQMKINKPGGQLVNADKALPDYLTKDVDFKEFWQVWQYVKENYVKSDVSDSQLYYGAMAGIVASLKDPYSVFLNPEVSKKFEEELSGSFEGIGAEIGIKDDRLTVIAPLPGTPADKAGLQAGDKIFAIDGKDTTGISADFAVSLIRGQKGTKVKLTIVSNGSSEPKEISITRDRIEIDSVKFSKKDSTGKSETDEGFSLKDGNIAYIELLYFNENTLPEWNRIVQKVLALNPKGIILDLRNNPGGFLNTAIEVTGEWVDSKNVVSERLRNGEKIDHSADRQPRFAQIPTVVLVNGGSASGSEIVAGALQDYGLAKLVGETTFGKGSVQDLKSFPDGSSVKLTIAEWLTPNGKNINEQGIKPDVEVKLTADDVKANKDPQLDKALEILKALTK
ncbi:MAG: S41 family peptidase [Candidatus Buchananbacteria bacterium]